LAGQFTGSNDELTDPARYQYREAFVLVDVWAGSGGGGSSAEF
jgi:hypothetical protein